MSTPSNPPDNHIDITSLPIHSFSATAPAPAAAADLCDTPFLSTPFDADNPGPRGLSLPPSEENIIQFLGSYNREERPGDRKKIDSELSLLIDYHSEHPDSLTWEKTSTRIVTYIEAFPLPQISDRAAVRRFLDHCVDKHSIRYPTSHETRARAEYLLIQLDCLSSPPRPPRSPRRAFTTTFLRQSFLSHPLSFIRTPKTISKPRPSLSSPTPAPIYIDHNHRFPPFYDTATSFPTFHIIPDHPPPIPLPSDTDPALVNYFQAEVYCASFDQNNADLRPLSALPFEECIARVLCSYNHEYSRSNEIDNGDASRSHHWWKLGDRSRIFNLAQRHCTYLLGEGKFDDVTRILSHVSQLDLIKSFIHHPRFISFPLVSFIVHDCKHALLDALNEFVRTAPQSKFNPIALSDVFVVLADPPPSSIDLSPLISYLARHTDRRTWHWITQAVFAYLFCYDLEEISDLGAVRRFLRLRLRVDAYDEDGRWSTNSDETRFRARMLLAEINSLFPSPISPIASTSIEPPPPPISISLHHTSSATDTDTP
ncbi:hypothetical protein SISSUDRAFT_836585 [Sistotremastrum suecicum HHB10207 ss-3]|uniref:Uncharacterized protein n=1 Tax=Sistotremastrum suecicum HHB10207 ss-3 TaxID=1314776 RepID=A0A166CKW4_9AGAM|nr:hypothetical protein SISSUDRAFT_836585 [Sistotremastrum suecicum HHB10207 ss-3]